MTERAQSELVGFVLVVAIVLALLGVVAATGYAGLEDARDFERTNNAQRGMTLLAENAEDVARGAPSRATELKLADATLSLGAPVTITVAGERVADPTQNFTHSTTLRPIVYDPGTGTRVRYTSGAIVRGQDRGGAMVRPPPFVITNRTTLLPITRTNATSDRSVGGTATMLVRTVRAGEGAGRVRTTPYDLTIEVTTPRADVWHRYLSAQPATDCSRAGTTVSCTATTRRLSVAVTRVRVAFA